MSNTGKATLRGDLARLRGLAMLKRKVLHGITNPRLAEEFNVNIQTVERNLALAKRSGLIEKFEDELLNELVPAAMAGAKKALAEGNPQVVLEILKGAGILKKPRDMNRTPEGGDGDSLEVYLRLKRQQVSGFTPDGPPSLQSVSELPALGPAQTGAEETTPRVCEVDGVDWVSQIPAALNDTPMVVVEGELVSATAEAVDEEDGLDA